MQREKLAEQLAEINQKRDEVLKQIQLLDHDENLKIANQYLHKCFIEKNEHHDAYIRCVYIYAIDEESCEPQAISLVYWKNIENAWFTIEFTNSFNPTKWEETDSWSEISKEEYLDHYQQVKKRIDLALSNFTS